MPQTETSRIAFKNRMMRIVRSKDSLILLVLFVISFTCFSIPVVLNRGIWFSTDQGIFLKLADNLRTRWSVVIPSPLNHAYQTSIIDSHGMPYVSEHQGNISKYPPVQSAILALLRIFIPNYHLIENFIAAWGLVFFYFLVKSILGKREALFGAITLMFTPIYYFCSIPAIADMTAFVVILMTIVAYLQARESNKWAFYILCSLLLGGGIWLKYVNIILIIPFFIHYLIMRRKGESLVPFFISGLVVCMCILALLFYHKWAFNSFFTTGYSYDEFAALSGKADGSVITGVLKRLFSFPIKAMMIKLTNFPIHIAICSPLTLLGILGCFSLTREQWRKFSLLLFISLIILFFYAAVASGTFGSEHYNRSTFSSYNRYILPTYCLLMIPALLFFNGLSTKKFYGVLVVITIINLSSLCLATINLTNLNWELAHQKDTYQLREKLLKLTTEDSIIIGEHIVFYMVNTNRHIIDCKLSLRSLRTQNELTRVVHALLQDGHNVYLVQDCGTELNIENVVWDLIDGEIPLYQLKEK